MPAMRDLAYIVLALALAFGVPVWSNDSDFNDAGVECYTPARLLRRLGISGAPR